LDDKEDEMERQLVISESFKRDCEAMMEKETASYL